MLLPQPVGLPSLNQKASVHVCMHVCMYVCMYESMHVCIPVYVCVYVNVYVCNKKDPLATKHIQQALAAKPLAKALGWVNSAGIRTGSVV
jgi:hypothetical protein